jgi:hypothetical protein
MSRGRQRRAGRAKKQRAGVHRSGIDQPAASSIEVAVAEAYERFARYVQSTSSQEGRCRGGAGGSANGGRGGCSADMRSRSDQGLGRVPAALCSAAAFRQEAGLTQVQVAVELDVQRSSMLTLLQRPSALKNGLPLRRTRND